MVQDIILSRATQESATLGQNGTTDLTDQASADYGAPPVLELLLLVLTNLACLILINLRNERKLLVFVPDQAISIFIGMCVGGFGRLAGYTRISNELMSNFSGLFFEFFLPPIIFASSYSIKRKAFFKNLSGILLFAMLGTMLSAGLIGFGLFRMYDFLADSIHVAPTWHERMPLVDALILGALLSAVDPVATLAVLPASIDRQVHALLFGESVLNDAVAIVIYNGFTSLHETLRIRSLKEGVPFKSLKIGFSDYESLLLSFVFVSIGSTILGVVVGLASAFVLKRGNLSDSPGKEQAVLLMFAYISYLVAREVNMSPVMSLFVTGATMSHYSFYNLSRMSQIATASSFHSIATVAETFVFVFLGVSVFSVLFAQDLKRDLSLITALILLCIVSRFLHICLLSSVVNIFRFVNTMISNSSASKEKYISFRAQLFLSWAGLRGAMSFALALHTPVLNEKGSIVTATIAVILFTFIVQGCSARWLSFKLGLVLDETEEDYFAVQNGQHTTPLRQEKEQYQDDSGKRSPSFYLHESCSPRTAALYGPYFSNSSNGNADYSKGDENQKDYSRFARWWRKFDDTYMKPIFGGRARYFPRPRIINPFSSISEEDMYMGEEEADESTSLMPSVFNQIQGNHTSNGEPVSNFLSTYGST